MKHGILLLSTLLIYSPAFAQLTSTTEPLETKAKTSISVSHKFSKHFSMKAGEELRFDHNLSSYQSSRTTLEGSCKINKYFSTSLGYCFILDGQSEIRHRFLYGLEGDYKLGHCHLYLGETLQQTMLTKEFNPYQQPRNKFEARTSLKAAFDFYNAKNLSPYGEVESRHLLNGARYLTRSGDSMTYTDFYLNRIKTKIGLEWKVGPASKLDFNLSLERTTNRDVDAKKDGTLKAINIEKGSALWLGVSYKIKI